MILLFTAMSLLNINTTQMEIESPYLNADSIVYDSTLEKNAVELNFSFTYSYQYVESNVIHYSVDGEVDELFDAKGNSVLSVTEVEGTHSLQFFLNEHFHEVYGMTQTKGQHRYYFTIDFMPSQGLIMSEKPVIYLYPEKATNVSVVVVPTGEMTFTYPKYDNGWKVLAHPDGTLQIGEDSYNYLFWESVERSSPLHDNMSEGFVISGKESTAFLEEKLTTAGLNSRERTDFITYWAPRMVQHESVFVQFKFNEECNAFAELKVNPAPDQAYRIYLLWRPTDAVLIAPKAQEIPVLKRKGFTLVEWGGQELPATNKKTTP